MDGPQDPTQSPRAEAPNPEGTHVPRATAEACRAPLVEAEGTRYEIGLRHGSEASELAHGTLAWSLGQLEAGGLGRDAALAGAMRLLAIVRAATPEMVEEVEGVAAGARMSLAEAALINTRYELLFLDGPGPTGTRGEGSGHGGGLPREAGAPRGECTLFGVEGRRTADGHALIGQNVDLDADCRPWWIMLSVKPPGGPRVLTVTLAGMLAQEGINSAGLALCGSMIRCAGWRAGYPSRKFLRRRVLEQRSVDEAVALIRSAPPRASSHNLMLADAHGRLVEVETTIDEVLLVHPVDGLLAHSNHYLSPSAAAENDALGDYADNSRARYERMRALLARERGAFTPRVGQRLLRDHDGGPRAICRHGALDEVGAETNIAVVAEPAPRRLHVALGPPCRAEFVTYRLDEDRVVIERASDTEIANQGEAHAAV